MHQRINAPIHQSTNPPIHQCTNQVRDADRQSKDLLRKREEEEASIAETLMGGPVATGAKESKVPPHLLVSTYDTLRHKFAEQVRGSRCIGALEHWSIGPTTHNHSYRGALGYGANLNAKPKPNPDPNPNQEETEEEKAQAKVPHDYLTPFLPQPIGLHDAPLSKEEAFTSRDGCLKARNAPQCPTSQFSMPNAQCPVLDAQYPMPNAQCPMPNVHAECPMPNAHP